MDHFEIDEAHRTLCSRFGAAFVSTPPDDKIGFAPSTIGLRPISGIRHLVMPGTRGWYIWCGESLSESTDLFEPQHDRHLYENLPDASHLFGLPPDYRFLLAGDYLDVWYDEKRLAV